MVSTVRFVIDGTAEILLHPARIVIVRCLQKHPEGLFVEQIVKEIADEVKVHPRMVSHHLDVLESEGLVKSSYQLTTVEGSKRRVAVRLCVATPHADEVLKDIRESI